MVPRYKKVVDLIRSNGTDIVYLDSDGNLDELLPIWLDCGINMFYPFEVASDMDAIAVRKKYGKDVIRMVKAFLNQIIESPPKGRG